MAAKSDDQMLEEKCPKQTQNSGPQNLTDQDSEQDQMAVSSEQKQ